MTTPPAEPATGAPRPQVSDVTRSPSVTALGVLAGLMALAVSIAVTVTWGPADLSVREVYAVVGEHLGLGRSGASEIRDAIVWDLRLPRSLLAAVCGAGLALCGTILQSLLRNPLADPFVLGISAGASTGAVLIVVLGVGGGLVSLSAGAFAGAVVSFALVLALAAGAGGGTTRVILAGVAGTQLFAALTSFIVISSADAEKTRGVLFWLLGSLGGAGWTDVVVTAIVCAVGIAVCLFYAPALDAFTFGTDMAATVGVRVRRTRAVLLTVTALLTAALVAVAGAIGFVGLVLPHAARFLVGPRHGRLLPAAVLLGAVFMVWVDALSRTVFAPREIPVGVVTALVGVPAFALILFRMRADR